jgi:hypothetical protein
MARRDKKKTKKKSLARRIRRLLFLASATAAIVRFAMARRPKPASRAPEWAPLRPTAGEATAEAAATDAATRASPEASPGDPVADAAAPDWVQPVDGTCPATHPVKGNKNSRIFHVPGGRFYDTTVPERCYRDPSAAEADGMRASKR